MIWQLDFWMLVVLIVAAVVSLEVRRLTAAVIALSAYSFLMAVLFASLAAVDVAFTEAALGAGLTGVLLITALHVLRGEHLR